MDQTRAVHGRNLTVEECEELATGMSEDVAVWPPGPEKKEILKLAQDYRDLAAMKRLISRTMN
jgi:hypothetical protein